MNVLLTHSNHIWFDEKQRQKMQPYPPLQTLLAAAVLRDAGVPVAVCDVTFHDPAECLRNALANARPDLVFVCEDDFNFLTKMCLKRNREVAFATAAVAKQYGCKTAVHGSDSSDHVAEYLRAGFDYVLLGEVEEAISQLAQNHPPAGIRGLAYLERNSPQPTFTPRRALRGNLDELPLPAWDLIDIDLYREAWKTRHGYFSLNVVTSRGCPYRCNWCAKPIHGNNYRVRSAPAVAHELMLLKRRHAPDHIWFADDIFALSARWTTEFADAVEEMDAVIPFKMQSRCDLMTRSTVCDLKRAGCVEVWMGAESGSQRILDAMEKGISVEQIYRARRNLSLHDIRACWFLQFGYTSEGWADIEATIAMVRQTRPHDVGISVSYPLPGTRFYDIVAAGISKNANWSESGDLRMTFRGTFSTELYRALARAIHLEVRESDNTVAIGRAWRDVYALKEAERLQTELAS